MADPFIERGNFEDLDHEQSWKLGKFMKILKYLMIYFDISCKPRAIIRKSQVISSEFRKISCEKWKHFERTSRMSDCFK